MPFVKIDLFEGRTEEQKIELAREVTEVVSRVAKAPKEAIHVRSFSLTICQRELTTHMVK